MDSGREPAAWLSAGRVGRPHGLDGSFYVTQPRPQLLALGVSLRLGDGEQRVVRRAGTDAKPILRLDGISSREAVEAVRGGELTCPRTQTPALADGEWWAEDLEGCLVTDGEREVGRVVELRALPSCEVLAVERAGGGELLVPMVSDAVRAIDVRSGRIDVSLAFLGEES